MLDGTVAKSITDKETKEDAISSALAAYASAIINANVSKIHVEAKNNEGFLFESKTWIRETE